MREPVYMYHKKLDLSTALSVGALFNLYEAIIRQATGHFFLNHTLQLITATAVSVFYITVGPVFEPSPIKEELKPVTLI